MFGVTMGALGRHCGAMGDPGEPRGIFFDDFGVALGSLGSLLKILHDPLGSLGIPWEPFWDPLGSDDPWGAFLMIVGSL